MGGGGLEVGWVEGGVGWVGAGLGGGGLRMIYNQKIFYKL